MPNDHSHHDNHAPSRARWVFLAFLIMAGALLFTEHRAHVLGVLPWLFLFACPVMHIFMHGGHGYGAHRHDRQGQGRPRDASVGRDHHP